LSASSDTKILVLKGRRVSANEFIKLTKRNFAARLTPCKKIRKVR